MSNKRNEFYSPAVRCTWANLARPDEFRGSKKHTIQIEVTPELEKKVAEQFGIASMTKETVAGFLPAKGDYPAAVTVKTTEFTKKNEERWAGNLVDIKGQPLPDYLPGSGDTVRVKIWVTENEKLSFWLNGIQVLEQTQSSGGASGWEDMSGDEPVPAAPAAPVKEACGDCPTAGCDDCPTPAAPAAPAPATADSSGLPF